MGTFRVVIEDCGRENSLLIVFIFRQQEEDDLTVPILLVDERMCCRLSIARREHNEQAGVTGCRR